MPARTPRGRHPRPASARVHLPSRFATGRSHGLPSPRRLLAEQVIAWHNRHPLARRIARRQLGGWGVVGLPFSPAPADAATGSGWAESASTRFPMFDTLPFRPALPMHKVVALALAEGWAERPGAPEWPLRQVPVGKGWDAAQAETIYLLTACIKRTRNRPPLRVLVGRHGPASAPQPGHQGVVGHRVLSRPRMGLAGLVAALPLVLVAWGAVSLIQNLRPAAPLVAESAVSDRSGTTAELPAPARPGPVPGRVAPPMDSPAVPADLAPAPPPSVTDEARPRAMPKVGPQTAPPTTRAAAPTAFRLISSPERDGAALQVRAQRLQAVLDTLGHTGARLRLDVVGTPNGDALAISPPLDQAEAERVARRLKARGFVFQIVPQ
jgi:hypothetical protein